MPRRYGSVILPFDEKRFRFELKAMRRQYGHLDEYLPYLQQEVDTVRKLKEAGEDPRTINRADDSELR
jgi:response regulator of citrate/malate metabolism